MKGLPRSSTQRPGICKQLHQEKCYLPRPHIALLEGYTSSHTVLPMLSIWASGSLLFGKEALLRQLRRGSHYPYLPMLRLSPLQQSYHLHAQHTQMHTMQRTPSRYRQRMPFQKESRRGGTRGIHHWRLFISRGWRALLTRQAHH